MHLLVKSLSTVVSRIAALDCGKKRALIIITFFIFRLKYVPNFYDKMKGSSLLFLYLDEIKHSISVECETLLINQNLGLQEELNSDIFQIK